MFFKNKEFDYSINFFYLQFHFQYRRAQINQDDYSFFQIHLYTNH